MILGAAGQRHEARVLERTADHVRVEVDGRIFDVGVSPAAAHVFRVRLGETVETVHAVAAGDRLHVFWQGRAYVLSRAAEAATARAATATGTHESPMPGRVVAVKVKNGDSVAKGQPLVVIEAMKMENVLRAARDGVVRTVAVAEGDRVTPGQSLVELE